MNNTVDFFEAFSAAASSSLDVKAITKIVPEMLRLQTAGEAQSLIKQYNGNSAWLPEALALFNIRGLSGKQKREIVASIFPDLERLNDPEVALLADSNARIGRYGFSFPQWRFLTQGFAGPSLIEQYGMTRLERPTDVRDPVLPKSDPNRDQYGPRLVKTDGEWTVEYRRDYILCANEEGAILIRNSSYFFGRDRLAFPAYVSWNPLSSDQLRNIGEGSFSESGPFADWQKALQNKADLPITEKLRRVQNLLDHLDQEDMALSLWLRGNGAAHTIDFIKRAVQKQAELQKTEPPFYVAFIDATLPPWFPLKSISAANILNDADLQGPAHTKMLFLSGPNGDLPLKAAQPAQNPQAPLKALSP